MTTKTDNKSDKTSTLAVSLEAAFREPLRALADKKGCAETHLARLALAAFLTAEGYKVPEVVEAKKGPKGAVKPNPKAEQYGLTTAEYNRRVFALIKQGMSASKIEKYDFHTDPAPVKHREKATADSTGSAQA